MRLTSGANAALCLGVLIDPEAPNLSWAPLGAVPCGAPGSAWVLPGNGNLRHEGSGQCVDLFWNSRTEGALLGLHDCSDAPAQTWAVHASGSITLADDSTWCLGLSHHGMAVLVLCERGLPAHTWSLPAIIPSLAPPPAPHAPAAHFFTIHHSVSATLCVSPGGEAPANGSPAVLATCAEGPGAEVDAQVPAARAFASYQPWSQTLNPRILAGCTPVLSTQQPMLSIICAIRDINPMLNMDIVCGCYPSIRLAVALGHPLLSEPGMLRQQVGTGPS